MINYRIPVNRPTLTGHEFSYMAEMLLNRDKFPGMARILKCQTYLEQALGVPKVLLTTSCTHALEMAALLLEIQPGDGIILPSFTFVSTVNAFVLYAALDRSLLTFAPIRSTLMKLSLRDLLRLERKQSCLYIMQA